MKIKRSLLLRLLVAYAIIPLVTPALLTFSVRRNDGSRLGFHDYASGLPILGTVTLISMVVLGSPALFLFYRFKLRSFLSFAAGGCLCAVLTVAITAGRLDIAALLSYGVVGAIAGTTFRIILFGMKTGSLDG